LQSIKAIDMSNIKYICPAHGDIINAHPQWEEFIRGLSN
jgi:flavorubredoxin